MKKRIPLGLQSYDKLKTGNYYVVDKSLMIQDFLLRGNEVTLITRPRRFGKTLNMSMMASFFDITKDSQELFKDTAIMKSEHASAMNQYPTIFLSFANAKNSKQELTKAIKYQLRKEYDRQREANERSCRPFNRSFWNCIRNTSRCLRIWMNMSSRSCGRSKPVCLHWTNRISMDWKARSPF